MHFVFESDLGEWLYESRVNVAAVNLRGVNIGPCGHHFAFCQKKVWKKKTISNNNIYFANRCSTISSWTHIIGSTWIIWLILSSNLCHWWSQHIKHIYLCSKFSTCICMESLNYIDLSIEIHFWHRLHLPNALNSHFSLIFQLAIDLAMLSSSRNIIPSLFHPVQQFFQAQWSNQSFKSNGSR